MNLRTLPISHVLDLKKAELLTEFCLDGQEYLVFQLNCNKVDIDKIISTFDSFREISRFQVNNTCCIIMHKLLEPTEKDLDLSNILSNRELQIATLIAMGCPNKQVARKLHISEWTVATHLRRIFAKLRVDTRAAMIYHCASLIRDQDRPPRMT